jgi:hypothetical protein
MFVGALREARIASVLFGLAVVCAFGLILRPQGRCCWQARVSEEKQPKPARAAAQGRCT